MKSITLPLPPSVGLLLLFPIFLVLLFLCSHASAAYTFETSESEGETSKVEVVEGYNASLPCSITSPPHDTAVLTLWYIGSGETPVYSYDQRHIERTSDWSEKAVFGGRARYLPYEHPPVLHLTNVTTTDARRYRCRVDYKETNSRQAWVELSVIVPPSKIEIINRVSPVELGEMNDVGCRVSGGSPPARVVWMQAGKVVDNNATVTPSGTTVNDLQVPASRRDLRLPFTCQASNNDVTAPLVATHHRNVSCGPLSVSVTSEDKPLVAGRSAELVCTVVGSNPPPLITWFLQGKQVASQKSKMEMTGNVTVSMLRLQVERRHHRSQLVCRAQHPTLPRETKEDIFVLDVSYKPLVNLTLGRTLNARNLKEGIDLFFECSIDANPRPYKIRWLHQGEELVHNVSAGVIVGDATLALQAVKRHRSGRYECEASNVEGDSRSNDVSINIKYAPRCAVAPALRGVALLERTNITCAVDADPVNVSFNWTFNNSLRRDQDQTLPSSRYTQDGLRSTLTYTPTSERDYGTLQCYATNVVGKQEEPCSFTLISAGPPEEVNNCTVLNVTSHSAGIRCLSGFDGGLPQRFLLQVWEAESGLLMVNTSSSSPVFAARPLEPGRTYKASVASYNSRGRATPSRLLFLTLKEAEMHKSLPSMVEPSPLVLILGVITGVLVVVGALLLAVWLVKERRSHGHHDSATVTQIVLKDNNPDLLSVEAPEEGVGVRVNGSVKAAQYAPPSSGGAQEQVASYQRYEEDATSLYGSSSPEATERTRLTTSSNTSASKGGGGAAAVTGRGGGSLGVNLLRGGLGGSGGAVVGGGAAASLPIVEAGEQDLRRQTTVRLFMSGSPEVSF
ncbi:hemicentin-1-like isoform X1 [Portunus trituberculatus]|uniref:hemicentin-1-like isoform X1 n=1 Tax=Portunus trituberculatus TaxID=210409 RepID=UPI001E1CCF1E|nr:hemicentin-1-like isoform X1 [Portunus trituberculatus]XP_045111964.1 hemicentin-1-like isoform X1 [Portunus trituberculatus]